MTSVQAIFSPTNNMYFMGSREAKGPGCPGLHELGLGPPVSPAAQEKGAQGAQVASCGPAKAHQGGLPGQGAGAGRQPGAHRSPQGYPKIPGRCVIMRYWEIYFNLFLIGVHENSFEFRGCQWIFQRFLALLRHILIFFSSGITLWFTME